MEPHGDILAIGRPDLVYLNIGSPKLLTPCPVEFKLIAELAIALTEVDG